MKEHANSSSLMLLGLTSFGATNKRVCGSLRIPKPLRTTHTRQTYGDIAVLDLFRLLIKFIKYSIFSTMNVRRQERGSECLYTQIRNCVWIKAARGSRLCRTGNQAKRLST